MPIGIISCQYKPEYKDPLATVQKVNALLEKYDSCDILVLPEMALPGYKFADFSDIKDYLEKPQQGYPTFDLCSSQAKRLGCYVFCGYAEIDQELGYNSMMVVNPQGQLIKNSRKKHLYFIDKTWAVEGDSFHTLEIEIKGQSYTAGLGICMDINPYEFEAPFEEFELASAWEKADIDFGVFCTNWTYSTNNLHNSHSSLLNYWITRLQPLLKEGKPRYFISANRIGGEQGISYMGSSSVIELGENPQVAACLGVKDQASLFCEVN